MASGEVVKMEAQCRVPLANGRPLAPGNPAPSTRRMAAELARIAAAVDPMAILFLSDRKATVLERQWTSTADARRRLRIGIETGVQQMQAGRPDDALNTLEEVEKLAAEVGGRLAEKTLQDLQKVRAISFLRLGEQENCIGDHRPESCLFPLVPQAFHKVRRGSESAVAQLEKLLGSGQPEPSAIWLLNIAHMTLGQYPAGVPERWRIPPSAFESEYGMPRMPDVAGDLGLDINGQAGGVVADDFDNDGLLDLFVSEWGLEGQLRYFRNTGDGGFVERTSEAGLVGLVGGLHLVQTDFDNDGRLDLWIPRGAWMGRQGRFPQSLLHNNGDGTFTDVTEAAGLLTFHPSQSGCWFDFDGDGWLDLFKANETMDPSDPDPCELFRNNRDGTFTECAARVGLDVRAFVKAATWSDYDHDGRPDLYLSLRNQANLLFHNDGPKPAGQGWSFTDVTPTAGVREPIWSFPTWFFDYDNDGWDDLFVSGYDLDGPNDIALEYLGRPVTHSIPRLYRNRGDGRFQDVTQATHLGRVCHTMGSAYGDLDNDGWLDFYLATGDPDLASLMPNRMFRNDGGRRFLDVTTTTGTGHLQKGHGVTFADLDNDGDQDVYAVIGGAYTGDVARNVLFGNPGHGRRWLNLRLEGTRANRAAVGARVAVVVETPTGPRTIHRTVGGTASFGGRPLRLEIGLGDAASVTKVEVVWPGSGTVQTFTGVPLDSAVVLREGTPAAAPAPWRTLHFPNNRNLQPPPNRIQSPAANGK